MSTDPSVTAREIVDELALVDDSFVKDRELATRVVETMLADRPEAAMRPWFRRELRERLLAAAASAPRRTAGASGLSRLRSFFVGSGVGTAVGAIAAYAFLVFVAPVSPDVSAPMVAMDGPVAKMQPVAPGDAGIAPAADEPMDTMLADTAPASEPQTEHAPAADIPPIDTAPVPATDTAPRPQAGGGAPTAPASEPRTEPVPVQDMETVANSVRNSLSSTASSQPAVSESASLPRASSADKSAEDPFSLSDIFPSQPAAGGTASIMADSVQSSPVLAPDPSNYVVEASTGAVAALSSLPKSVYSYFSDIAQVAVPRSLSPSFSSSSRLSLRFMTAVDDAPYGLSYSIDTVGGSIFAVKNDIVWPVATAASGAVSDERIIAATDAVIRPIRAGVIRFGSGEIIPDTAGMDTVTVRYPVVAEGVGVYEAYGMPREATVSYDRSAARVSGFSLPHVTGFSRTADTFSSPDETSMEKYVRHELAGRGYVAGRYRIESARYALAPETKPNPGTDAGKETLVPSILLEVTSDAGIRDMFVMPFGR